MLCPHIHTPMHTKIAQSRSPHQWLAPTAHLGNLPAIPEEVKPGEAAVTDRPTGKANSAD